MKKSATESTQSCTKVTISSPLEARIRPQIASEGEISRFGVNFSLGKKKKSIQYVAVKSVEKNRRRKVLNEAKILGILKDHINVLKFYNFFETRNHLWLIFEFCPGADLYSLLNQDKK